MSIANARAFEEIDVLRARLEEENLYLREEVTAALGMSDFVGESPALQKVLRQVQLVAPTDASVLITGESGTGKELVARKNSLSKRLSGTALQFTFDERSTLSGTRLMNGAGTSRVPLLAR